MGYLQADAILKHISDMKTSQDEQLTEKEIAFFMKSAFSEKDTTMDIGHYADLLARIKAYKRPPKRT